MSDGLNDTRRYKPTTLGEHMDSLPEERRKKIEDRAQELIQEERRQRLIEFVDKLIENPTLQPFINKKALLEWAKNAGVTVEELEDK